MSSHFMALLKCFHLNHYGATWITGINLPLCSAYNDRSSKGESVSVGREQLLSHASPLPMYMHAWEGWNSAFLQCYLLEAVTPLHFSFTIWQFLLLQRSSSAVNTHSFLLLLSEKESSLPSCWFSMWASRARHSVGILHSLFCSVFMEILLSWYYDILVKNAKVAKPLSCALIIQSCVFIIPHIFPFGWAFDNNSTALILDFFELWDIHIIAVYIT